MYVAEGKIKYKAAERPKKSIQCSCALLELTESQLLSPKRRIL